MAGRWHDSWREGRIGFHSSDVNSDLTTYADRYLEGGPHRVLVPLCGKTVDIAWLAEQGHEVVGIELVPQAVDEFVAEQGLQGVETQEEGLRVIRSGSITIINGDFFAVNAETFGQFDRIWDRAALVALPKDVRARYVKHLRSLAAPGALLLQNVFEYDESKMDGPPFSVRDEEFCGHYQGSDVELLSEMDQIDKASYFREQGHEYWIVRNYLVTL